MKFREPPDRAHVIGRKLTRAIEMGLATRYWTGTDIEGGTREYKGIQGNTREYVVRLGIGPSRSMHRGNVPSI